MENIFETFLRMIKKIPIISYIEAVVAQGHKRDDWGFVSCSEQENI